MIGKTNADGGVGVFSDEATATKKHVLEGATYLGLDTDDELGTGEIPIRTSITKTFGINDSVTLPAGYYETDSNITQNIPTKAAAVITPSTGAQIITGGQYLSGEQTIASLGGNAPASMVHPSYSFSSDAAGRAIQGTMPNRGGYWGFGNNKGVDAGNQRMWVQVPGGYYDENAQVFLSWADIRNLTGLTPDKIKKGVPIMGITGSFQGYTDNPFTIFDPTVGWHPEFLQRRIIETCKTSSYQQDVTVRKDSIEVRNSIRSVPSLYIVRLEPLLEVTAYNYILLRISVFTQWSQGTPESNIWCGLSTNPGLTIRDMATHVEVSSANSASTDYIINVSGVTGQYYLYFAMPGLGGPDKGASFTISRIELRIS